MAKGSQQKVKCNRMNSKPSEIKCILPSVRGFSKSSVSDVKYKTYVSNNFKASNFLPIEPGYKIKLKQLSGQPYIGNIKKATKYTAILNIKPSNLE